MLQGRRKKINIRASDGVGAGGVTSHGVRILFKFTGENGAWRPIFGPLILVINQ